MAGNSVRELDDDNFDDEIARDRGPILVDFWASWCAPCKTIAPALVAVAEELTGRARVATVDVDANGDLAYRFGITSVPTLVVFKDGKVVDRVIGAAPMERIRALLTRHMG